VKSVLPPLRRVTVMLALPAALIATWWFTSAGSQNFYFPPLQTILGTFARLWFSSQAIPNVLPSLARLSVGYLAAAFLGIAIGIPVGASRNLRNVLEPVLEFLRAIPPPVLVPVLILFAGLGNEMKALVIVFGCIWPVLLNTVAGVRALEDARYGADQHRADRAQIVEQHFDLPVDEDSCAAQQIAEHVRAFVNVRER